MKSHKDLVLEVQFCEINAVNFENKNILNAFLKMMDKCLQKSQQSLKHAGGPPEESWVHVVKSCWHLEWSWIKYEMEWRI